MSHFRECVVLPEWKTVSVNVGICAFAIDSGDSRGMQFRKCAFQLCKTFQQVAIDEHQATHFAHSSMRFKV
ncbi:hypothetical protein LHV18_01105 [Providencia rettgeri]|uniref:hypothetical protein n=1 Tax=Providencia rettgeri TaxID=587 RepID=UPI001CFDEDF0|nr:hypothetical protein [Providencia rettgeri]EIU7556868.1 hypothetical protein [Providencia rettgeri]MCB4839233.1 hypothetical protein [Providencia rettgeri]HEM8305107.1 hypothetical protein [Providencia rettgeri]